MDFRFCEQQESSPRGTYCELGNFAIVRLARSPRRAQHSCAFSLEELPTRQANCSRWE